MADLITSSRAKQGINQSTFTTAEDDTIDAIITAVSQAIRRYCRREFDVQTFDEIYSGTGDHRLMLAEYPINSVSRVSTGHDVVLQVKNTDTSNQRATVSANDTGLSLTTVASGVTTNESEITWASNVTIDAVKDAIIAKGNGWTAEVVDSEFALWPSSELSPMQGAVNAADTWASLRIWTEEISDFEIDANRGLLWRHHTTGWQTGVRNYRVIYSAGYSTIPEDLQEAATQWVASLYWQTKDNPAVYPDFPSVSIALILNQYRRFTV